MLFKRADTPTAVFCVPIVLNRSDAAPKAVFWFAVLKSSVAAPTAVLLLPSASLKRENHPNAEFPTPVVTLARAFAPSAVLNPGKGAKGAAGAAGAISGPASGVKGAAGAAGPSGAACAAGTSAKQTISSGMRSKPRSDGA